MSYLQPTHMTIEEQKLDHTQESIDQKRSNFFDKIALFQLPWEDKASIAKTIIYDIETGKEYRITMFLAALIATLGLLINSIPVVIWAMLIAPIMRPIQTISFATTTWGNKLFFQWAFVLLGSICMSIVVSIILTLLSPLSEITNEIIIRTQPTILDLLIALASGAVAFFAFGFKRLGIGIAWVAMAASLLPPLCVVWIGIARWAWTIARWSLILFLTNLLAILIAWYIVFHLFGFFPNSRNDIKKSIRTLLYAVWMIAVLCIPLLWTIKTLTQTAYVKKEIHTILTQSIEQADIQGVEIVDQWKFLAIDIALQISNETSIDPDIIATTIQSIEDTAHKPIEMNIALIPTYSYTTE